MRIKTSLIVGITIITIGLIIYAYRNYVNQETYLANNVSVTEQREQLTKDTDLDGLKDWEEELWATDPNKADTDGDGTPDGEEIRQGRSPVVAGPNDILDELTIESKINPEIESDLTRTDKFSRELFARYTNAKVSGDYTLDGYYDVFYKNIEDEVTNSQSKAYFESDIKIIYTENTALLKTYGNAVGEAFKGERSEQLEHELAIVESASTGHPEELLKLKEHEEAYKKIRDKLLLIEVPDGLVITHLELLNSIESIYEGVVGMQHIFDDPVKATAMTERYPQAIETLPTSLKTLAQFFREKKITFKQSDGGYMFSAGI